MRRASGSPATGTAGFARTSLSGRRRVPRPAVRIIALVDMVGAERAPPGAGGSHLGEQHVGRGDAARLALEDVDAPVRIEQVIGRTAPERHRHLVNAVRAALDLDERPDRRFVDCDDHVVERELFAVLLVAEPHVEPELFEHAQQHGAVADDGLELVAHFQDRRLNRTFEGEEALARLDTYAKHASAQAQPLVVGVEERVFLEAARANGCGAGADYGLASFDGIGEPKLDFSLDGDGRHGGPIRIPRFANTNLTNSYIVKHSSAKAGKPR